MITFMIKGQYSPVGVQGSLAEGYVQRAEYFRQLIELYGGTLTATYWPEGEADVDVFGIIEMPDAIAMKAIELAINQSGALRVSTIRLFGVQEMEAARIKLPRYRAPGESPPPLVS